MTRWLDLPLLLLLLALALITIRMRSLIASVVALGGFGFVLALEWALLGAVDVAFTEAAIGAGVGTVFMLSALARFGDEATAGRPRVRRRRAGLAATAALGVALVGATALLPSFGDPASPASVHTSPRYILDALAETATPNMVTAVLADYRSLDTLFETAVVFTAAMAMLLILGLSEAPRRSRP